MAVVSGGLSPLGDILGGKLGMFLHNLSGDFSLLRSGEGGS